MPPVSEKQRRAMWAAREGHSTLGIPASVGKKFVGPGRNAAKDMEPTDWRGLIHGLIKFFTEEAQEPEHQGQDAQISAAGIVFLDPENNALFLKRSGKSDHEGEYCFPGGVI